MSEMLEQAIVDAEALKRAAAKNAETLVLEKYSNQIKRAVESLLEQEEPMEDPLMAAPEGMPSLEAPAEAPADPAAPVEKSSVLEHIPLAATSKDDEEIEIPLDKLTEELAAFNESLRFGGDSHNIPELFEHNLVEFEDRELEEVLSEEEDDDDLDYDDDSKTEGVVSEEEEDDEEVDDLVEALSVDLGGAQKTGWAGIPESVIELAEEEILALEQDSKVREEKQEIRKALKKLEAVNENLNFKNDKLHSLLVDAKDQLTKLKDITLTLRQKLEESNLTNAKLIYQNKALNSASLNERQKNKLVEAVSNAESIEEAKVIFETLQSTVGSTSRKTRPKSLSEAIEKPSSMILSGPRRTISRPKKESPMLNRWKTLAGIDNK